MADSKASGAVLHGNNQSDRSILLRRYLVNRLKPSVRRSNLTNNHTTHTYIFQNTTQNSTVLQGTSPATALDPSDLPTSHKFYPAHLRVCGRGRLGDLRGQPQRNSVPKNPLGYYNIVFQPSILYSITLQV